MASNVIGFGTRIQEGIPRRPASRGEQRAGGLMLRGVVMATYVSDSPGHPHEEDTSNPPVAVYCDVLVMPSISRQRWFGLRGVLVSQPRGGMHHGAVWKPRATTVNLSSSLDSSGAIANPAYLDGDHVLIGFLNDNLSQPVILAGLPHPSTDMGNETKDLGFRMKLKVADGDPEIWKHHGIWWGVTDAGDFLVDTTYANNGKLAADGKEAAPKTDGSAGNFTVRLPSGAKLILKIADGASIEWSGSAATAQLIVGNGAVKAAIADHLQQLWGTLKSWLEAVTVPTGMGPSGTPINTPATAWNTNINSNQLKFPDNGA